MSYINKENKIHLCDHVNLGYIKNKDGFTTNPTVFVHCNLDVVTNECNNVYYTVSAFEKETTYGYHRSTHNNYESAKEQYDKLFEYHVG